MNGILNIYKESDFTSNDVVAILRGICHMKKIGHTGTLDPNATGVLPVCLGSATKLCDVLADHDKVYIAEMELGKVSDTQDVWGEIVENHQVDVSEESLRNVIMSFVGDYDQIPPMYSAKKINGQKLYDLARQGITVERKSCPVKIFHIEIIDITLPKVKLKVHCGKGTYIRTLCHDIGKKLGCGAIMTSLVRTRVGEFAIESAITLKMAEELMSKDMLAEKIFCVDKAFEDLEAIILNKELDKYVYNGNPLSFGNNLTDMSKCKNGKKYRIYDSNKAFQGVYEADFNKKKFMPWKMFLENK